MTGMQSKRIKMDKLLTAVLDAHGGLENWAKTTRITARISCRLGYPIMMHVATSSSGMSLTIGPGGVTRDDVLDNIALIGCRNGGLCIWSVLGKQADFLCPRRPSPSPLP
jgi:hypothetical protein